MCIWGSEVPPSGPAEKLSRPYKLLITEKQKKPPANKMNSVLYNYKYMYRRCRNIWTYVNESKSAFAETCTAKDRILEQLHRPTPRSSDPCPPSWTVRLMECLAARLSHFGLLFSFFKISFHFWRNERHFREILNSFVLEFHCGERYLAAAEKEQLCRSPLSSLTGLTAARGQSELNGKSTQIKGEQQFPERCTTEL